MVKALTWNVRFEFQSLYIFVAGYIYVKCGGHSYSWLNTIDHFKNGLERRENTFELPSLNG